ncbi:MAG: TonB-dependent receptor plug domain-containing protein [Polyangiaceae bacterium]
MARLCLIAGPTLLAFDAAALPSDEDPPEAEPAPVEPSLHILSEGKVVEPGRDVLEREDVRRLPGAFGDPFRAIDAMPGLTPTVSGLPFFFVRGAPPGNVGYYIDGVRVPYLFHVLGGPSIVHPGLIEDVAVHRGAAPTRFGRYAGGIVSATLREPAEESWGGEAHLRLIDVGARASARFADGRGAATVAGRYSYTGAIFSAISPDLTLDYRDVQAHVSFDVTERDRLSVFAFGSYDYYAVTDLNGDSPLFATEFYRVDTRYDAKLAGGGQLRMAVTTGFDDTIMADGRKPRDVLVGSRVILHRPVSKTLALDVGLDVQHDVLHIDAPPYFDPDDGVNLGYNRLFRSRNDGALATWIGLDYRPLPGVAVLPSLRLDGFLSAGNRAVSVDPRLRVAVELHPRVRAIHTVGMAHQPPSYLVPIPGLLPANLEEGLQTALQASSGVELDLPWDTTVVATLFDNVFWGLTDGAGMRPAFELPHVVPRSLGSAKGIELSLRRSLAKRLGGFISYTASRTTRSRDAEHVLSAFDRTHVLSAALGYDFGGGYLGGVRFSLFSGKPNLGSGNVVTDEDGATERDPAFYRIDFRFEKRWSLGERAYLSLVAEVVNATVHGEVVDGRRLVPVTLPSVGLEGGL